MPGECLDSWLRRRAKEEDMVGLGSAPASDWLKKDIYCSSFFKGLN